MPAPHAHAPALRQKLHRPRQHVLSFFLKRCFDITSASVILLALSPAFLLIMLIVRTDGGPAIFQQIRIGKGGRYFSCYKFRSMRPDAEIFLARYLASHPLAKAEWHKYQKLRRDVRITRFGQFLRRTSLDELPQFINVLQGDMSLIGPRPILPGQEVHYGENFIYYMSVRPGITGPWQVSGRNALTFARRAELECAYAQNWNLWTDTVILLKTVPAILKMNQAF